MLIRQPKDDDPVKWHEDGPAFPTYRSLGKPCPLMQIKIGLFLTDCEKENMGNLAIVPGSHLEESPPPMTFEKLDGMEQVLISKGDVILFHNALWHRVMDNLYDIRRENIYLAFCLPWMAPMDRSSSSDFLRSALPPDKRKLLLDFEKPGENYELRKKVFRSGLKSGLLAQIKNFGIMIKRRLRKMKHNFLGENVW